MGQVEGAPQLLKSFVPQPIRDVQLEGDAGPFGQPVGGLKLLDDVAYVRFASVYRSFRDVEEFMEELSALLRQRGKPESDDL